MSLSAQHHAVITEVKTTLDLNDPIHQALSKLDDPMDESEFLLYMMLYLKVPVILQIIDKPTDVRKIMNAKVAPEAKDEAIAWKCRQNAEKILWIHRAKFAEVTGLDSKLRDFIRKNSMQTSTFKYIKYVGGKKSPPTWYGNSLIGIEGGKKSPPQEMIGFDLIIDPSKEDVFFPSTALPKVLEKYHKKSEVCNALQLYHKSAMSFTKKCFDIANENLFLHLAERSFEIAEYAKTKEAQEHQKTQLKLDQLQASIDVGFSNVMGVLDDKIEVTQSEGFYYFFGIRVLTRLPIVTNSIFF